MLSRYGDCAATMRDPRLGKDIPTQMVARFGEDWRKHSSLVRFEHSLINEDGPVHSRLRKLVVKGFTRSSIEKLRMAASGLTTTRSPVFTPSSPASWALSST